MRKMVLAGMALAISACSGGGGENVQQANDMNAMSGDNMMMSDPNMMMDQNMSMNATAPGANTAVDANTQNLMMQDATSNDADTNLANGL